MKPYGIKHDKLRKKGHSSDCCSICSNDEWKQSKTRERASVKAELQTELTEGSPKDAAEIDAMITCRVTGDLVKETFPFTAEYAPLNLTATGVTPEHAIEKIANTYYENT